MLRFLKQMCQSLAMKASLAQNSLERFRKRVQDKNLLSSDFESNDFLQYTPEFFFHREDCKKNLKNVSDELTMIANILSVSEKWKDEVKGTDYLNERSEHVEEVLAPVCFSCCAT